MPFLLEMATRENESFFRDLLSRWAAAVSVPLKRPANTNAIRQLHAAIGLNVLGTTATPAYPALINAFEQKKSRFAAIALAGTEQGVGFLLDQSEDTTLGEIAMIGLGFSRSKNVEVLNVLLENLKHNTNSEVRFAAANSVRALRIKPEQSVAALTVALDDSSRRVRAAAASALSVFGPDAAVAIPSLEKMTGDPDRFASFSATHALKVLRGGLSGTNAVLPEN